MKRKPLHYATREKLDGGPGSGPQPGGSGESEDKEGADKRAATAKSVEENYKPAVLKMNAASGFEEGRASYRVPGAKDMSSKTVDTEYKLGKSGDEYMHMAEIRTGGTTARVTGKSATREAALSDMHKAAGDKITAILHQHSGGNGGPALTLGPKRQM